MAEPAKRFDEQKFKKEAKHLFGVSDAQISPDVTQFIENSDDPFKDLVIKSAVRVVEAPKEKAHPKPRKAHRSNRKFFGGIIKEAL